MGKHDPKITEYTPELDNGTYQTGSTQPPKYNRGLIAALMITITCLGGLASVLGILNIHLLLELGQHRAETAPVYVHQQAGQNPSVPRSDNSEEPTLPNQTGWNLDLAEPESEAASTEEILSINADSTVSVLCQYVSGNTASLTGVVIDEAGFIVTNAHPISDAYRIFVTLSDGRRFRAALVGVDGFTDLAVIFIDATGLTAAEFVNSDALAMGDFLAYVCDPKTLSEGSFCSNDVRHSISGESVCLMQTDLGNITGPIYNANGQIAGFGSYFLSDCCPCGQSSTALSSITVKSVVEQIIAGGTVAGRPCVDAEMEEVQVLHQCYWDLPGGLRVTDVEAGSLAAQAGVQVGDILTALDSHTITDWESYYRALWTLYPGQQVQATLLREGRQITVTITIARSGQ